MHIYRILHILLCLHSLHTFLHILYICMFGIFCISCIFCILCILCIFCIIFIFGIFFRIRLILSSRFQKYITSQVSQVLPLFVSVVTWWYWISMLRLWLVLGGTGSEQGSTGCQCSMLSENIWFTWCTPSNYSIFREGKK